MVFNKVLKLVRRLYSTGKMDSYSWSPLDMNTSYKFNLGNYALVILNRPIKIPPKEMMTLWSEATIRSAVDGGAARWFDYLCDNGIDTVFPDIVSGDFDSISPDLLDTCKKNGSYLERTPDQDYTDFEKALTVIKNRCDKELDSVLVILDISGRLDHTFSNINTLYRARKIFQNNRTNTYLLTSVSVNWLLQPGNHTISIPPYLRDVEDPQWCAILPFSPVKNHITTTGLKWNLDNSCIEFGGLISSSNTYDGKPEVTVNTDADIIWCMGYRKEN